MTRRTLFAALALLLAGALVAAWFVSRPRPSGPADAPAQSDTAPAPASDQGQAAAPSTQPPPSPSTQSQTPPAPPAPVPVPSSPTQSPSPPQVRSAPVPPPGGQPPAAPNGQAPATPNGEAPAAPAPATPTETAPAVPAALPEPCRDQTFETVAYVVCEIDLRRYAVTLHRADAAGTPYASVRKFTQAMRAAGTPVLLAMNAGMYHSDLTPVGLFVAAGREEVPLNRDDADGNFFLKPNGVFYVDTDGKAGVLETGAFAVAKPSLAYATQSGPMLVIDGALHPRFEPNGSSRYIRNGVGVRDPDTVVLAISRGEVSLGSFARLFRDGLGCRNALFFDGAISTLTNGTDTVVGGSYPAGPILAVTMKENGR